MQELRTTPELQEEAIDLTSELLAQQTGRNFFWIRRQLREELDRTLRGEPLRNADMMAHYIMACEALAKLGAGEMKWVTLGDVVPFSPPAQ